jgi:hypothetical protein
MASEIVPERLALDRPAVEADLDAAAGRPAERQVPSGEPERDQAAAPEDVRDRSD